MVLNIYRGGSPTKYSLGRGRLLLAGDASAFSSYVEQAIDNKAYRDVGNCTAFSITQESETKEHTSYLEGIATRDLELAISTKMTVNLQLDEVSMINIARFLSGEVWNSANFAGVLNSASVVSTLPTSSENFFYDTAALDFVYDLWYQISIDLGAGPVAAIDFESQASQAIEVRKNPTTRTSADGTVLTEGTHYELDRKAGMIRFLISGGGGLQRGDVFRVSWAAPTVAKNPDSGGLGVDDALSAVRILTNSGKTVALRFIGENPNDGNLVTIVDLWAVKLRPDGELQLISDEWTTMGFTGALQAISNPPPNSSPYGRILQRASYST